MSMSNRILVKAKPFERGTRSNKHIQTYSLNRWGWGWGKSYFT